MPGEIGHDNPDAWFLHNSQDTDITTNSLLRVKLTEKDLDTWDSMDAATFNIIEQVLSPGGLERVECWHGPPDNGEWSIERPARKDRRVPALVHESSTLFIGADPGAPVDLDYRFKSTSNIYVTGGGLWPQAGSWNPTLMMVALAQD